MSIDLVVVAVATFAAGWTAWLVCRPASLRSALWMLAAVGGGLAGVMAYVAAINFPQQAPPPLAERLLPESLAAATGAAALVVVYGLLMRYRVTDTRHRRISRFHRNG